MANEEEHPFLRFSCQGCSFILPIPDAPEPVCWLISDFCGCPRDPLRGLMGEAWYVPLTGGHGVTGAYSLQLMKTCACQKFSVRYQVAAAKE